MRSVSDHKQAIIRKARALGFDTCRFTAATLPATTQSRLNEAIELGHHATMDWLEQTYERRRSPESMWPEAETAILFGMNYGPDTDPMKMLGAKTKGNISVYARNRDYHEVIKGRLKQIAQFVASAMQADVKVFVDTAPLLEKPLAAQAGMGWQGKHTNLVSREFGSWLFIGAILTSARFETDASEIDHCGSCRTCLDICPTDAFPAPYQLDARRCISYLTIEHKGPIPIDFREAMGNRIFGCDDCLAVCPWNKFAATASEAKLIAREDLQSPFLAELLHLDDAAFRSFFSGSPVKRIGRNRFMRNVLIAAGNSDDPALIEPVTKHLADEDPVVRGAAVWALSQLEDNEAFDQRRRLAAREHDPLVIEEWQACLLQPQV
ncbi:MAG: tRNA epoxyqueuosine(34) reductase QueG [Pseudomonadota bacterium]